MTSQAESSAPAHKFIDPITGKELPMRTLTLDDFYLKNVKTFRGMEGEQFEAALHVNGINGALAQVWDDGWGGCLNVDYKKDYAEKLINYWCSEQPEILSEYPHPHTREPYYYKWDIEMLVNKLMDRWHDAKEAKRWEKLAAENVMFKLKGDKADVWRSIKLKQKSGKILERDKVVAHIKAQHGDKLEAFYGE